MSAHAIAGPSGASGWMACAGWRSAGGSSEFAREGTAAHDVAAMALESGNDAAAYTGRLVEADGEHVEVTDDMTTDVQPYIAFVRDLVKTVGGTLLVEQRLPIEHLTGEVGAAGTADAVILAGDELIVADLKFGRGVRVDAQDNEQLQIYALAALRQFDMLADFERVRMVIHQPRRDHVSEWTCTVKELRAFAQRVTAAARLMLADDPDAPLNPGQKQCRWCAKKATCSALQAQVMADFESVPAPREADADDLAHALAAVDMIESWCKAVRGEAERRLLAGQDLPGFKLVEGRRGARRWANLIEVEAALKAMRLKHEQMYDYSLISPTAAEKLAKTEVLGPRQWSTLQSLITQAEGKPSVAPDGDPRIALQSAADDFTEVA